MTCGCNGLLSSFNLARNPCLWKQGGDSCLRRLTVYRRNYRAAKTGLCSVNTIVVIYYLSGRSQRALSFTGCRRHCASEEKRRCESAHANTDRYLAPSNVHVIFRKTLLTAESWDCRQWWEQPILHKQAFNRRSSKGERKRIFKEWSWYQDTVECCIEGVLSFFFPRGEVKKADAKPYSSSITRKKLNCSENSFVSGRLV